MTMELTNRSILEQVEEFHLLFKHPVLVRPTIPVKQRVGLRVNLIQEELDEFSGASDNHDIVEVADALGDILYVVAGTILEYGLQDKMSEVFSAIHKSNMTKACSSKVEALETVEHYESKGYPCFSRYEPAIDKWVVLRTRDNKVLKSINYTPVDIKTILDGDS